MQNYILMVFFLFHILFMLLHLCLFSFICFTENPVMITLFSMWAFFSNKSPLTSADQSQPSGNKNDTNPHVKQFYWQTKTGGYSVLVYLGCDELRATDAKPKLWHLFIF